MKKSAILITIFSIAAFANAQQNDTVKKIDLKEVIIQDYKTLSEMARMPDVKENVIYAGKKTEVIQLDKINADLSTNNTRQVFAKIPGMSIWENDGSGIQAGVASRGLSPNRSWEFNVRQNGYDVSSEVFGYPETYYTPPMEALVKIEVIRGASSLKYGPQFGGLLNYQIKKGNPNKAISFETQQTVGSYGLFNTYHAIGGTHKKFSYYGFLHHRSADGWRNNSRYNIQTVYFSANYQLSKKINLSGEYTNMNYKSQQPGGLTDVQFKDNHRQSLRERNWFGAPFNVASLTVKYDISQSVNLQIKSFATIAERNSVGFTKSITTTDSINQTTLQYNARQVDRDHYKNYGTEARVSIKYKFFEKDNIFAGGLRAYRGNTKRDQLGIGTTGNNYDLTLTNPQYGRSLEFGTTNYAAFAENIFQIGKRLKVVPGIRFDYIENQSEGYINTTQTGTINPDKKVRQLLLYGIGSEFMVSEKTNIYGNYSSAYRPVTFSELTPSATNEIIDPDLKDASGFNVDFGYRGSVKNYLSFDVGLFYLLYDNRIGTLNQNGSPFKTNIGTSVSKGVESYIEINVVKIFTERSKMGSISFFASNSLIDAKYVKWNNPAISSDPAKSIENKRVENAPPYIHRFGATYYLKGFSATFQLSNVGEVFTDAANTETPNETGTIGKLSGYQIMDASLTYKFMDHYTFKAGVNNITDEKYATRRAGGYPGPGILPGNGRTIFVSVGASF
ncbi:MAG: TonB-dependent receptor [Saprospiraceae bacterium]|nr:TonB-dependent receptor [Candidatus Vicinibacter affinis]